MALTVLGFIVGMDWRKFECRILRPSLVNPFIITHFFSENALVLNTSAAVSDSSVSSRRGSRHPTQKLRALAGTLRTHHDRTTPAVGKKTSKCKAVFQELKKKIHN